MRKKISKFLLMVLVPVVMFMTAGILSFSNISGAYSSARALSGNGGVVYVGANSTFNMTSGGMSGSKATNGGAVCVAPNGTFNMSGGSIYGNIATNNGNNINNAGTFTMTGGTVGKEPIYSRVDEDGNKDLNGNYVLFGSYPQTIKASGVTINTSDVDGNGYYLGSDGERYLKFKATLSVDGYIFSDGSTITKDVEYYFKVEPIKWEILTESHNTITLLSNTIIDIQLYLGIVGTSRTENGKTIYNNNYKYSDIRSWLNKEFYKKAFSNDENNIIEPVTVDNSATSTNSDSNIYACDDTEDKVWLLSYQDLLNADYGFGNIVNEDKARQKMMSDYSRASKTYSKDDSTLYNGSWWTRSPNTSGSKNVWMCNYQGGGVNKNTWPKVTCGVVPAISISKNDETITGYSIYNTGTMNLYGGNVYDSIYSSSNINTKMAANIAGTMHLADGATITIEDYAGTTPNYTINLSNARTAGTILTFKGNSTEPDLSKLNITGFDTETCKLKTEQDANGNWTVVLHCYAMWFPSDWETQIKSTKYMTTTVNSSNLTSIKFAATVPEGYTQIGTLSTGLPVYKGTTSRSIAFVYEKIYAPINSGELFYNMYKLPTLDLGGLDTSKVTNMYRMFYECKELTSLDVSKFNTGNVTNMKYMFLNCSKITNLDVANFDTSKVTDMSYMFAGCKKLTDLNVSAFNTSKVTDMSYMFQACSGLTSLDLRSFDTSKVTNMSIMFTGCSSLTSLDVGSFDTSNVIKMTQMFNGCSSLTNLNLSNFNTSNVVDMEKMFSGCPCLISLDVGNFNTAKITKMWSMFYGCRSLTSLDLSSFDTSNVTSIAYMFYNCSSLTSLDISNFDTANVADMSQMFYNCSGLTSLDISNLDTSNVVNMGKMFSGCSSLISLDLNNFNTSKVTDMSNMFYNCSSLTSLEISDFNTSNVTTMSSMFYGCSSLTSLDISNFDTSNIVDMSSMFAKCSSLTSLDVSNFNTSNVTTMSSMFYGCGLVKSLDFSNFNTSKVTNMSYMFYCCYALTTLDVSSFNMAKVTSYWGMLNFVSPNKIKLLKTPYNNTAELAITTDSTLYNQETGEVVTSVPAGTTKSLTYVNQNPFSYLPSTWKTEIASTTYMTTTLTTSNLTSVKFVKSVPSGYTQVGTLSTSLPVYANTAGTEVAFVGIKILAPENSSSLFAGLTSVTGIDFTAFDTSKVTNMSYIFANCSSLINLDLSKFNTSNVTNMSHMFNVCLKLTALNIENFDTSKVSDMSYMFYNCQKITSLNLSNFNTTNVTNLSDMFEACKSLVDLNLYNFDTSNITDMTKMFYDCSSIVTLDLSNFNTANVTSMLRMFVGCTALKTLDLSSFDLSKTNSAYYVLDFGSNNYIETLKTPFNNTSESHITTNSILYDIEKGEIVTSLPANTKKSLTYKNHLPFGNFSSGWKSEIVSTSYMTETVVLDDLRSIKFVTSLPDGYTRIGTLSTKLPVFANADKTGIAFVADKIYAPANSYQLFKCNYITELDIGVLDTSKVTNMSEMFYGVIAGEIDISGFDTSNVTTMNSMFHSCWNVKSLDFSHFNTSKVTDMICLFYNCIALTDIDLFSFDTSNVTNIGSMFYNCRTLKTVNLKSFNTAKVTQMERVFYGCLAIESLDLKNFDTSSVGYFDGMFEGCTLLKTIDLSSFDTSKAIRLGNMFYNCENIESLDLSHFVGTNLDSVHSMFKGMKSLKYLDISNMNLSKVTSYTDMLNFGANNNIETLKTPYGCKYDLAITSGSKLYNVETGERVTTISANTASSMTLVNIIQSIDLPSDWQTQVASATYNMKEAVTVANLTSVKFVSTVPDGYTKIGELLNNLPVYANADRTAIAFVAGKKITAPADSTELFYGLTSVTSFDFEVFDTSSVTDMTRMFMNCNKLVDVDFGKFNTENVTKMNYMFRSCSSLVTLDLSSFNTAKVQDMNSMFNVCGSLVSLNVSSFDTSKVNDMTSMFSSCSKLVNISLANFNTCNVSSMDSMFFSCSSLVNLDLSNFDTTNLHSVSYMFSYCAGLKTLDLSSFNLAKVSQYIGMLNFSENNHIETFKTPYGCKAALPIISGSTLYNESGAVISTILANASASMTLSSAPPPVTFPTDWKTQLTGSTMTTTIVAGDLTSIAFERSVPTGYTQIGTIATSILVYKSTSVDTDIVFVYAGKIKAPVDSSNLFKGLTNLVNLTFNNFDTSDTTTMLRMFTLAKNSSRGFTTNAVAEVEKFDTFNTTLENLDLSMFDTSKVVSMAEMFYGCVGIKTLDCSSFDMSKVANWTSMFNFTKNNTIKTLKLPYNNTGAIPITTGSELFGDTADQVTLIPANNVKGKVLGTKVSIHFVFTQRNFGVDTPAGIAEIKSGSSSVQVLKVRRGMSWEEICDEYNLVAVGQTLSGENMTTAQLKENAYKWWTIFGEVEGTEKNPIFRKGGTVSEIGVDGFRIEFFYDSMYCLSVDTEIDVYDEKRKKRIRKKLKDISYKDKLLVWNFDKGCFDLATPLFITKPQTTTRYTMVWFSNGSSLRLVGADDTRRHRVFCLETGKFEYVGNGAKVGMTTYNDKGEFVKITKIEFINEKIEFMNIITNEHFNCFANGILTSCKLSNMYPIKDMKYDKTNKTLNTREMFEDISDFYYKALRLAEQPLLNTYNDHSEYIDYKQIYEIEWENSSFKRNEK